MKKDGLRECSRKCVELNVNCPIKECRLWINYESEHNCTLVSIYENGPMTLREIAERHGLSFARIKQIETKAMRKLKTVLKTHVFFGF